MELLTFEWRRARSIRTTWITSLFVILGALFFAFLGTVSVVDEDGTALRLPATDLIKTAVVDNPIAMVLIASLGAMAFGHEYRYGTIRLTLTAFPRRPAVFFAKFAMTVVIALVVSAIAVVASYALLLALGAGEPGGLTWAQVAFQVAVFAVTYALLAFSLTVITRNHPLGIIGPLLLYLLELTLVGFLGERLQWLPKALPLTAMQTWFAGEAGLRPVVVWAAWIVGLLIVGFVLLRRRDA